METKEAVISTISEFNNDNGNVLANKSNVIDNVDIDKEELAFLFQLREKTLVLFEGLRHKNQDSLESRMNIVIGYLEFQLSIIEDRISRLSNEDSI